jgi:acetyltransferase-like isoleucine patch superfamily enzyme
MPPSLRHLIPQSVRQRLRSPPLSDLDYGLQLLGAEIVSHVPVRVLRSAFYRAMGMRLADRVLIYRGLEFRKARRIEIGEGTVVGFDCILDGRGGLSLGRNVNLSSEVAIWTMQHDHRDPDFAGVQAPVNVGDRAWLSFRCTILPGVTVGEGAVIAAGAVVVKDVPPYAIMAGVPATQVSERPRNLRYEFPGRGPWFV